MWTLFKEVYNNLIEKHVPHKLVKGDQRHGPPWVRYTSVKRAKKKSRKAFIKARTTGLESDHILYNNFLQENKHISSTAKAHYEQKLINDLPNNPKRFWNYSRHFTKSSSTIDVLKTSEENNVTDPISKAEMLNKYF